MPKANEHQCVCVCMFAELVIKYLVKRNQIKCPHANEYIIFAVSVTSTRDLGRRRVYS